MDSTSTTDVYFYLKRWRNLLQRKTSNKNSLRTHFERARFTKNDKIGKTMECVKYNNPIFSISLMMISKSYYSWCIYSNMSRYFVDYSSNNIRNNPHGITQIFHHQVIITYRLKCSRKTCCYDSEKRRL